MIESVQERTSQDRPSQAMAASILSIDRLTPTMTEVRLSGETLAGFRPSGFTDEYVDLLFPRPDTEYPEPFDLDAVHAALPPTRWPAVRSFTVRRWDAHTKVMTVDVATHHRDGVAGQWARTARPGDPVLIRTRGGTFAPDPLAEWHLFAGDQTALPAIAAALEALPADASGHVLVEVPDRESRIALATPSGVMLTWVCTGVAVPGRKLVEAVRGVELPFADIEAFVRGEAAFVTRVRRLLLNDRRLRQHRVSASAYWDLADPADAGHARQSA